MFLDNDNGAGGAVEPEEIIPAEDGAEDGAENNADPLDAIEDETARALAKAERAKARREARRNKAEDEPAPKKEPEGISSAYATKDDLKKLATNDARKMVAPELNAVWDELVAIPLGGFDPMDSQSIVKNMEQRYVLYTQQQKAANEDPTKDFTTSPAIPQGGGATKGTTKGAPAPSLPGYREATPPTEWYK